MSVARIKAAERIYKELDEALKSGYRYIRLEGGTSAAKTYTTIQYLILLAMTSEKQIDIASPTMPHLKGGAMSDWKEIMNGMGTYDESHHNRTDHIYDYGAGRIKFTALDQEGKARGPRRDVLFVNEANLVSPRIFDHLSLRTRGTVIFDYNPAEEQSHVYQFDGREDTYTIICTYKDNPFVSQEVIREIEGLKDKDDNLYKVYALGQRGRMEGLVLPNHEITSYWPDSYKWRVFGMDFGFSNNPTAFVEVRYAHGELYARELIYERGMTNQDISDRLSQIGHDPNEVITADCAEPKSIAELARDGWRVKKSPKGRDSINQGLDGMRRFKINVEATSTNLAKELSSYRWDRGKDDNPLNKPIDAYNHAIDAMRYALSRHIMHMRRERVKKNHDRLQGARL